MGIDLGTALMMLLRWFGSVALIIVALAMLTLLLDRLRNRLTRTTADETAPSVHRLPPPVQLRPQRHEVASPTSGQVSPPHVVF